jgi:hypothetical protein
VTPEVVEEFSMRTKRFTLTYFVSSDVIVMTHHLTGQAASYNFDEFEHAVRLAKAKRRREGDE